MVNGSQSYHLKCKAPKRMNAHVNHILHKLHWYQQVQSKHLIASFHHYTTAVLPSIEDHSYIVITRSQSVHTIMVLASQLKHNQYILKSTLYNFIIIISL